MPYPAREAGQHAEKRPCWMTGLSRYVPPHKPSVPQRKRPNKLATNLRCPAKIVYANLLRRLWDALTEEDYAPISFNAYPKEGRMLR